jgi:hypothetical protein
MKYFSLIIFLLGVLESKKILAQNIGATADTNMQCAQFKTGIFKLKEANSYTIFRTPTYQLENNLNTGRKVKLDIKWLDDCNYLLYNYTVLSPGNTHSRQFDIDTLRNKIMRLDGNNCLVNSVCEKANVNIKNNLYKLEQNRMYRNITELESYETYKGRGKAIQSIDLNYTAGFYQKGLLPEYLLAFAENYELGDSLTRYYLLDFKTFALKPNQKFTLKQCKVNKIPDTEVVAIYEPIKGKSEYKIIKAWRCNRLTNKIESLDSKTVSYLVEN